MDVVVKQADEIRDKPVWRGRVRSISVGRSIAGFRQNDDERRLVRGCDVVTPVGDQRDLAMCNDDISHEMFW